MGTSKLWGQVTFPQEMKSKPSSSFTDISQLERLDSTKSIWFLPEITREEASDLLKKKEPGSFIIRKSQQQTYALSVNVRDPLGIQHFIIVHREGRFWLEDSDIQFDNLVLLVLHYSCVCDELPEKLSLPPGLAMECSVEDLTALSQLGKTFWTSPLYRPNGQISDTNPQNTITSLGPQANQCSEHKTNVTEGEKITDQYEQRKVENKRMKSNKRKQSVFQKSVEIAVCAAYCQIAGPNYDYDEDYAYPVDAIEQPDNPITKQHCNVQGAYSNIRSFQLSVNKKSHDTGTNDNDGKTQESLGILLAMKASNTRRKLSLGVIMRKLSTSSIRRKTSLQETSLRSSVSKLIQMTRCARRPSVDSYQVDSSSWEFLNKDLEDKCHEENQPQEDNCISSQPLSTHLSEDSLYGSEYDSSCTMGSSN